MSESLGYRRFVKTHYAVVPLLAEGRSLDRRLTGAERRAVAIAGAAPTHLMTLNSASLDREEIGPSWARFKKQLQRRHNRTLIYLAAPARSTRGGGFHLHVLLWGFLPAPMLHGIARRVGFGSPHIHRIAPTVEDRLFATVYVCGQTEPVFGSDHHRRHRTRERWSPRFSRTSDKVLKEKNPELLSALERSKDCSISDRELVAALPTFIGSNG
jgi:hypothetical protein